MKILKLWVVTSCTVADRNMLPSSSEQKLESYTKIFIPTYQIMWYHIVNSDETIIQRVLPSPKVALDTTSTPNPPPPPRHHCPKKRSKRERKFTKFCAKRGMNHLQCMKRNIQSFLFCISMYHRTSVHLQFQF